MRKTAAGGVSTRMYPMQRLEDVVHAMRGAPDAYLSQGSFLAPRRRVALLSQIRAAWVDIDCYSIGAEPSDAFVEQIIAKARSAGIPAPSYVVRSGRGLYAKWIFESPIGAEQLPQWKELQSCLVSLYKAIGADVKAKDAARVLRVLGTTNSKAADASHPVQLCWDSRVAHDFRDFCATIAAARFTGEFGGFPGSSWDLGAEEEGADPDEISRARRERTTDGATSNTDLERLSTFAELRRPILLGHNTVQSLNWQRFLDIRSLATARRGVGIGWRDEHLFWMLTFLGHAEIVTPKNFWSEAKDLAGFMDPKGFNPTEDGSLKTLYSRMKAKFAGQRIKWRGGNWDPLYTATTSHLIDLFSITREEQEKLSTLIGPEEKARRRDLKAPGRAARREERTQAHATLIRLVTEGKSPAAAAEQAGIARRWAYKILAQARGRATEQASDASGALGEDGAAPRPTRRRKASLRPAPLLGQRLNRLADLEAEGLSVSAIARELETTPYRVNKALIDLKLRTRRTRPTPQHPHDEGQSSRQGQDDSVASTEALRLQEQQRAQRDSERAELVRRALMLRADAARLADAARQAQLNLEMSIRLQRISDKAGLDGGRGATDDQLGLEPQVESRVLAEREIERIRGLRSMATAAGAEANALLERLTGAPAAVASKRPEEVAHGSDAHAGGLQHDQHAQSDAEASPRARVLQQTAPTVKMDHLDEHAQPRHAEPGPAGIHLDGFASEQAQGEGREACRGNGGQGYGIAGGSGGEEPGRGGGECGEGRNTAGGRDSSGAGSTFRDDAGDHNDSAAAQVDDGVDPDEDSRQFERPRGG